MRDKEKAKLYVYNQDTGSLSLKSVTYRQNEMEAWYEDARYHTFDPFYVDADEEALKERVYIQLTEDLQDALSGAEQLMDKIRKLSYGKVQKKS